MNHLLVVVLLAFIALINAVPYLEVVTNEHDFNSFKIQHGKDYINGSVEHDRQTVFEENQSQINASNKLYEEGKISFKSGANEYSDMSHKEFTSIMNGYRPTKTRKPLKTYAVSTSSLPSSVDWRTKGAVTPVKSQQQCGSCWAFGSTGALEAQTFLKTGKLISLSEQNLVDCTPGNDGCDGGSPEDAFQYIQQNRGIDTEQSYPYIARDGQCQYNSSDVGASDSGYVDIAHGDEDSLTAAVANIGPIAVAIDASHPSFQHYKSGIYNEPACNPNNLDHTVLVVGYDTDSSGRDYYIVKNSWGTSWGENGYIKMPRNQNNQCGIASWATYPQV